MKITKILSASVLAGVVLLSASGCSSAEDVDNITGTNAATPTAAPSEADPVSDAANVEGVLLTINGYYNYVSQPDSLDKLETAEAAIVERPASDESIKLFAEGFSEGFKYFDTSTADKIRAAHQTLMDDASAAKRNEVTAITVPGESVTITGNAAKVSMTPAQVPMNGEDQEVTSQDEDIVNLVKNDSGSWVIVAKNSSAEPIAR